jgi:membrane-associated phospholipid phosphatase
MEKIIDRIGFHGPKINFIIGFISLLKQPKYLSGYLVFTGMNYILNGVLKTTFQEARPPDRILLYEGEDELYKNASKYGMPSGHAQSVFFALIYLYLVKHSIYSLLLELCIALITCYQRWKYRRHTISQLIVGSLIGILFGGLSFSLTKKYIESI